MNRRSLLGSAVAGAAALSLPRLGYADDAAVLVATTRILDVKGKSAKVLGLVTAGGGPLPSFTTGGRFTARLENQLAEPTLVHWHGLTPPSAQDGVPELSRPALAPGQSYAYDFPLARAGTYWMHSHVGLQEQQLLAAPLIVRDPADAGLDEQEVVLMLHDFSFTDPDEILARLVKKEAPPVGSGMTGHQEMAQDGAMAGMMDHGGMARMDHGSMGEMPGMAPDGMNSNAMAMDLNDIVFDAFLANDRTLDDPEIVRVEPGGRVRLRIINGGAATNFRLDLGALEGVLTAVDGQPVAPVRGRTFELAMAQRLDLRLALPKAGGSFPILAQREGDTARTGIILAGAGAPIAKIGADAAMKAPAIGLDLERLLRSTESLAKRPADRVHQLDLTGSMAGYVWTLNGRRFADRQPLMVTRGQRVEIVMRNRTMMSHPMHLHGHHFQVVAIDGMRMAGAVRDTVLVPMGGSVTIAFDADNPGRWAFHCHNLYHMAAGMMTSVEYERQS